MDEEEEHGERLSIYDADVTDAGLAHLTNLKKLEHLSLDYAPVLDINTNPRNPVIGARALSERPEEVSALGAEIIRELQRAGVPLVHGASP